MISPTRALKRNAASATKRMLPFRTKQGPSFIRETSGIGRRAMRSSFVALSTEQKVARAFAKARTPKGYRDVKTCNHTRHQQMRRRALMAKVATS